MRSRFYLRLLVEDRPGVLADVTRVLADHHISIASVIQHEAPEDHEGGRVHLVIMTHTALTGDFRAAVAAAGSSRPRGAAERVLSRWRLIRVTFSSEPEA